MRSKIRKFVGRKLLRKDFLTGRVEFKAFKTRTFAFVDLYVLQIFEYTVKQKTSKISVIFLDIFFLTYPFHVDWTRVSSEQDIKFRI